MLQSIQIRQLRALKMIGEMAGMYGRFRSIFPEDVLHNDADFDLAVEAVHGVVNQDLSAIQRIAYGQLLDFYMPEWRKLARREVLGQIVERDDPAVRQWREAVLMRDGKKCRRCGSPEELHAHHILRWVDVPEARLLIENGLTLCAGCHRHAHSSGAKCLH